MQRIDQHSPEGKALQATIKRKLSDFLGAGYNDEVRAYGYAAPLDASNQCACVFHCPFRSAWPIPFLYATTSSAYTAVRRCDCASLIHIKRRRCCHCTLWSCWRMAPPNRSSSRTWRRSWASTRWRSPHGGHQCVLLTAIEVDACKWLSNHPLNAWLASMAVHAP